MAIADRSIAPRIDRKTPLITAKDVLWFLYLYVFRPATAWVSPAVGYGIARWLEPVWRLLLSEDQRRLRERLVQAFGKGISAARLEEISRRHFINSVVRPIDELYLDRLIARNRTPPEIQGLDHRKSALAAGNGAMVVNFHFFANRAAKRWLAHMGYPILSVRSPQPWRYPMGRFGHKFVRPRYGEFLHGIVRDEVSIKDRDFTLKILQCLRAGGMVNIYLDAQPSDETCAAPFLGRSRVFPSGYLKIARLSGCAIVPMLCTGGARRLACIMESQVQDHPDCLFITPTASTTRC